MPTLINHTAHTYLSKPGTLTYKGYQEAFKAVDGSIREEMARENFGGPNHNDQWRAAGDLLELSQQAGNAATPAQGEGMYRAYLSMLAALPQNPDAQNIGTLIGEVAAQAPEDAMQRKGYLLGVTLGGAHLAATFATETTLQALTEALSRRQVPGRPGLEY